jgi:hypothetical protein
MTQGNSGSQPDMPADGGAYEGRHADRADECRPRLHAPSRQGMGRPAGARVGGKAKSQPEELATSVTAMLKEAGERLAKIFAPLAAMATIVSFIAPGYCYVTVGLSIGELGLDTQDVASVLVAVVSLAFCCAVICVPLSLSRRLRRRFTPTDGRRRLRRRASLGVWTVGLEIFSAATCAAVVGYEWPTFTVAQPDQSNWATLFLLTFAVACAIGCAASVCALVHLFVPRTVGPWVYTLLRIRDRYRKHRIGVVLIGTMLGLLLSCCGTFAVSTAVAVQLQHGRAPGILGRLLGISATCAIVVQPAPSEPSDPVLRLGVSSDHTVVIDHGEAMWLPGDLTMQELPKARCASSN